MLCKSDPEQRGREKERVCVCVQTVEGHKARAPVCSELAAMFTYAILPTLRKHDFDPSVPGLGWEQYKRKCAALAQEMGIPHEDRHMVTLPFYISFDWDPRHTWVRQFMADPGRSVAARRACDDDVFREHLVSTAREPIVPDPASDLFGSLGVAGRAQHQHKVRRMMDATEGGTSRARCLEDFRRDAHVDILLQARFTKSRHDKRFLTVIPQQFMPLSKVSPDIHSPVEHMVKTVKTFVREKMLDCDLNDGDLWKGKTYQGFIEAAVAQRGNGVDGRKHVTGSVRKQECICKILAAKDGERIEVRHVFGDPGPKKKDRHVVVGTGGGWIKDTRWT